MKAICTNLLEGVEGVIFATNELPSSLHITGHALRHTNFAIWITGGASLSKLVSD
jgi:hypothetical protein